MNGDDFVRMANTAFAPFLSTLGFKMDEPSISGRHYLAEFNGSRHVVSVSFEPGDYALFVYIFSRKNGTLSDIDDPEKTPRLSDLNSRYMSSVTRDERAENDAFFESVVALDTYERSMLKAAKELRLVLPKHLRS